MSFPTPHLEKLTATLNNDKLPERDKKRVAETIKRYHAWIEALDAAYKLPTPADVLKKLVSLLNDYKLHVELELIFDSEDDFLYRQKGQLKLDNSIIEEFLPRLIHPAVLPEMKGIDVSAGPTTTFSAVYFESGLDSPSAGGGMNVRTKDQDFAISKKLYLKASHNPDFKDSIVKETYTAYVVAEVKTNLDKTMFQEACATAHDVKASVSGAHYYLLCEWLDMTPVSTAATDIDEVIILRKSKRLSSNIRKEFDTYTKRKARRADYLKLLKTSSIDLGMIERFLGHINKLLHHEAPVERNVLQHGYF